MIAAGRIRQGHRNQVEGGRRWHEGVAFGLQKLHSTTPLKAPLLEEEKRHAQGYCTIRKYDSGHEHYLRMRVRVLTGLRYFFFDRLRRQASKRRRAERRPSVSRLAIVSVLEHIPLPRVQMRRGEVQARCALRRIIALTPRHGLRGDQGEVCSLAREAKARRSGK